MASWLCLLITAKINSGPRLRVTDSTSPFCTGRRPKPEIVASKEQQIQRDDPGTSTQSSNQPDNSRLSRKARPELGKEGGREGAGSLVDGSGQTMLGLKSLLDNARLCEAGWVVSSSW